MRSCLFPSLKNFTSGEIIFSRSFTLPATTPVNEIVEDISSVSKAEKPRNYNREYHTKNKEKLRERQKEYNIENKEKISEKQKEYRLKNKEKINEKKREYYLKNKEKIAEMKREYIARNKEIIGEKKREYYLKNKENIGEKKREYNMKNKENRKKYIMKNKEKISEKQREYRLKNKEKRSEKKKEYRINNKEKISEKQRTYFNKNKQKLREKRRIYFIKNKEKQSKRQRAYFIKKNLERDEDYIPRKSSIYAWKNRESARKYFEFAAKLFHISHITDWYRVSTIQIKNSGGAGMFRHFGTLGHALQFVYNDINWDFSKFSIRGRKRAVQRWLCVQMKNLLPNVTIIEEYSHPALIYGNKRKKQMRFDIWVGEPHNFALEYQGEQHYKALHGVFGPGSSYREIVARDIRKKQLCKKHEITLIEIGYWWDGKVESLSSTLNLYFPDIFPKTDFPSIPSTLPENYGQKKRIDTSVYSYIMLGRDWNNEDPQGWYMSEKLDGIRAYWDGTQFWTKRGSLINVPDSFKKGLPAFPLDGELWGGYENTDRMNALLKAACVKNRIGRSRIDWNKFKFCIFDAPQREGTYQKRHLFLQNLYSSFQNYNSNVSLIPVEKCLGRDHLLNCLEVTTKKGGEGIMIYHPGTYYEFGRTNNLLKVKKYFDSVVHFLHLHLDGYSLVCQQENGSTCLVKCTEDFYLDPPTSGDPLTVRHLGFFSKSQKYKHPVLIEYDMEEDSKQ